MVTSIGIGTEMTATAVNAGVSQIRESKYFNKAFNSMKMALVPNDALKPLEEPVAAAYPGMGSRQKHLLRLCGSALTAEFSTLLPQADISVFLAGPEELFGESVSGLGQDFLSALMLQTGLPLNLATSRLFSTGRAGVLHAIEHAFNYMQVSGEERVLVGGVDSYRDLSLLGILDSQDRVLADGVMDGFVPGEGAGFLILSRQPEAGTERSIRLSLPGLDNEPGSFYSTEPSRGDGLSNAFNRAISNGPGMLINTIFASLNGENFWAKELAVAMSRNQKSFSEDVNIYHPADSFGDIGAAFVAVILGIISHTPGSYLVYGASDSAYRGAICAQVT